MTNISERINVTARALYLAHGEYVAESYDFSKALTPLGRRCWDAAVLVYHNDIEGIADVETLLFGELNLAF